MTGPKAAAILLAISGLASACTSGGADPAPASSPTPAPTTPSAALAASLKDRHAAGVAACDTFREAVGHSDAMGKGGRALFAKRIDVKDPATALLLGNAVWVDDHWANRISESLSPDVPGNVRAALEKVVSTGQASNVTIVQERPDKEVKDAFSRASSAADSADRVCGNFKE